MSQVTLAEKLASGYNASPASLTIFLRDTEVVKKTYGNLSKTDSMAPLHSEWAGVTS